MLALSNAFVIFSFSKNRASLTQEDAIHSVIELYPDLAAYQTISLPPSSIEAKQTTSGWSVGFIQRGSGVVGILNAKCYQVSDTGNVVLIGTYLGQGGQIAQQIELETCEPVFGEISEPPFVSFLSYGNVTLKLNETAPFKDLSIRTLSIEEDSRCPSDVQCIQAGTVRVKVQVVSGMGTSTSVLKLEEVFTTEAEVITLTDVRPYPKSTQTIASADYRLVFNVVSRGASEPPVSIGKCYIGGCSSQLCTDQPDAVSTCEYRAEYGCYKSATCKRQPNGQCGWTQTAELRACLITQ